MDHQNLAGYLHSACARSKCMVPKGFLLGTTSSRHSYSTKMPMFFPYPQRKIFTNSFSVEMSVQDQQSLVLCRKMSPCALNCDTLLTPFCTSALRWFPEKTHFVPCKLHSQFGNLECGRRS